MLSEGNGFQREACVLQWRLSLYAVYVRTVTRVNFNHFSFIDEERNTNFSTSFKLGRLQRVGGGVALETWLGVNNLELGLHWHFSIENGFR